MFLHNEDEAAYPEIIIGWSPVAPNRSSLMLTDLRNEKAMLSPIYGWLASQGFFTKDEFRTPWGICDLVGVKPKSERVMERIAARQTDSIGSMENLSTLLNIPTERSGRKVTVESLATKMGRANDIVLVDKIVRALKRKRLITLSRNDRIQRQVSWMPFFEKIVAIEFKLARIDEALAQATHHKAITQDSYVALPAIVASRVTSGAARASFAEKGVGLISLSANSCDVVIPPAPSARYPVNSIFQSHVAERFWRDILETLQH